MAKLTVTESPLGSALLSTLTRSRPERTVTRVVEPSKLAPSGSDSVTLETPPSTPTVPSQVRRVFWPPMTPSPPLSFGRAVAFSTLMEPVTVAPSTGVAAAACAALSALAASKSTPKNLSSSWERVPSALASARALSRALVRLGLSLETTKPYCSPVAISRATARPV